MLQSALQTSFTTLAQLEFSCLTLLGFATQKYRKQQLLHEDALTLEYTLATTPCMMIVRVQRNAKARRFVKVTTISTKNPLHSRHS